MENITLGNIQTILLYVIALAGSITTIIRYVNKGTEKVLKPINDKVDKIDKNATMNFLVRCFGDLDRGNQLDEATKIRMYEQYGYYTNELKGNTYIHDTYERLKREGKL